MSRRWAWSALIVGLTIVVLWTCLAWINRADDSPPPPPDAVNIKVQLDGARDHASLMLNPDGTHSYVLMDYDGTVQRLSPQQFAERLYRQQRARTFLSVIFNISHPIGILWVCIGLLGQVLFTGRMVVQWLASEKTKRSVVPPMFWWMSLVGSMMLLAYFTWRRDIVGILGQGFGLAIYLRNLHLIYKPVHVQPPVVKDEGLARVS